MCKQAREDVKRFQLKSQVEKEIVKLEAERQDRLLSALTEMNKKIKKAKEPDVIPPEDKMPDAAQSLTIYNKLSSVSLYQDWLRLAV